MAVVPTLYEGLTSQALCSGHPFSLFRVSWFNLKARFFVPTRRPHTLSRAGAVKVGRRTSLSPKHRCLSGHALTAPSTSARWYWPGRRLRGEPAFCSAMRLVPRPCIRWVAKTHTHDAIMRIGGEAPRRRAHSTPRHESHVGTRVAATSNRHRQTITLLRDAPKLSGVNWKPGRRSTHAGRMTMPSGMAPSCTSRHKAISSLRASATIMILRIPRAFPVRWKNH